MLEDMDKKNSNRSVQGPLKGNGTEPKKQDVPPNSKQYPRSRKREPFNNNGSKYEQSKKPTPQKVKSLDKRPRSRGNYCGSRKEDSQIVNSVEDELEIAIGEGKRRNLNHLLNFHYERRFGDNANHPRVSQASSAYTTKALMATKAHKYNKEHFLQANCQFVVRSNGEYSPYLSDPDLLVDWSLIELIRVTSNDEVNCPICLYPPVAGKITRCGHVFCWSCILHYLALSDKSWRKCPICFESIHKDHLKSVQCITSNNYSIGQVITFNLMKREKGTLIACPVNQHESRSSKPPLLALSEPLLDTNFSKLLTADLSDVLEIIDKERIELDEQMKEYMGTPELCFVEEAYELLGQRASLVKVNFSDKPESQESKCPIEANFNEKPEDQEEKYPIETILEEEACSHGEENNGRTVSFSSSDSENVHYNDLLMSNPEGPPTKYFYFYQASNGQKIFLHSLNVRMLEMEYGSIENSPTTVNGTILEIESGSMTPELRNRLRYLQHLPVTCQFEVIEIALAPPLVQPEVLDHFHAQIESRKHRRLQRARREKRRSKAINEIERKMMGQAGYAPNLRIESHFHFPECGGSLPPSAPSPTRPSSESSSRAVSPGPTEEDISSISSVVSSLSLEPPCNSNNPSFAQMLREGSTIVKNDWPSVNQTSSRRQRQPSVSGYDSDSERTAFSPPAKPTFTIAEALKMASLHKKENDKPDGNTGRKKKKKKQTVLFTTGMACSGN